MEAELFIPGRMPGLNEIIALRAQKWKGAYSEVKRTWTETIVALVQAAGLPTFPRGACLDYTAREPDKRRDPGNVFGGIDKFVSDALVKAGVLKNDGWKGVLGLRFRWELNRDAPGVLVRLSESPE
jgi:hypothetical protein